MQTVLLSTILSLLFLLTTQGAQCTLQWTLSASQSFSGLSLFIIQCLPRSVLWWKGVYMTFATRMLEWEHFHPIVTQYIKKVSQFVAVLDMYKCDEWICISGLLCVLNSQKIMTSYNILLKIAVDPIRFTSSQISGMFTHLPL